MQTLVTNAAEDQKQSFAALMHVQASNQQFLNNPQLNKRYTAAQSTINTIQKAFHNLYKNQFSQMHTNLRTNRNKPTVVLKLATHNNVNTVCKKQKQAFLQLLAQHNAVIKQTFNQYNLSSLLVHIPV